MSRSHLIGVSGLGGRLGSAFSKGMLEGLSIAQTISATNLPIEEVNLEFSRLSSQGVETFLHLGWPASTYSGNYRESKTNFVALEKTLAICRACVREGIHFIGVGSVMDKFPEIENIYSITKFVAREVLSDDIERGLITWVRPYFIFDELEWPRFAHAEVGGDVEILDNSPKDFIHLDDVAAGLEVVIRERIRGEVDLGSGVLRRPAELVTALGHRPIVKPTPQEDPLSMSSWTASLNSSLAGMWHAKKTAEFFGRSK